MWSISFTKKKSWKGLAFIDPPTHTRTYVCAHLGWSNGERLRVGEGFGISKVGMLLDQVASCLK